MQFYKYHAIGNAYLVIEPVNNQNPLSAEQIQRLCDVNYGIGSDGILVGPYQSDVADFGLKIFNPDGSEAEKSGNGLRIFSRYLFDTNRVSDKAFSIETLGGIVQSQVFEAGQKVQVEMGRASFFSRDIPVAGAEREVLQESIKLKEKTLTFSAASMGNPHCVVYTDNPTEAMARQLGPELENHAWFPHRINVQFVKVLDRKNLQMEIWERGAGYTHASGSSSCAAFAISQKLGLCDRQVTVNMRGGKLLLSMAEDGMITMTGPVTAVCQGMISL